MNPTLSCTLRVGGEKFDVDAFLATSPLDPCAVFRVGEKSIPSRPPRTKAGFNVSTGDADLDDFSGSVQEGLSFLRRHRDELLRLCATAGVSGIELDFGVAIREEMPAKTCRLPAELVHLAAEFKMVIEVSYYKCEG